jgi:hypothetical protein
MKTEILKSEKETKMVADKVIPSSVLKLLGDALWPVPLQIFQPIFNTSRRAADPTYYFSRLDDGDSDYLIDRTGLGHADVENLIRDGVFAGLTCKGHEGQILINEHAVNAHQDFCSEVYVAWRKYLDRLNQVRVATRAE